MIQKFLDSLARRIASNISQSNSVYSQLSRANFKGTDDQTLIEEGYLKNGDMYSIIQMDVKKFSSIPVNTYKIKVDEQKTFDKYRRYHKRYMGAETFRMQRKALEEVDTNNEIAKLLQRPNPAQGSDQFWQTVKGFYNLTGEAFIWKARDEGGNIEGLYVLPSQFMVVVGSSGDLQSLFQPAAYVLRINGQDIPIEPNDVIHWKSWNPEFDVFTREQLRGVSPLKALARTLQGSNEATDAMVSMYQNGGAKGVMYNEMLTDLSAEQAAQLKGVIDKKVNNTKVKAAVAALQGKWGYLDLGMSSVDMQLLESLKVTRKQFADAFGIPADLVEGDKTYANREQSMKDWVSNSIYPSWKSLCDELNRSLIPEFGISNARIVIDVDVSLLPEMQDDQKKLAEIASLCYWWSFNEKRTVTGMEKDPKMEGVYLVPSGMSTLEQIMSDSGEPLTDQQIQDLSKLYEFK